MANVQVHLLDGHQLTVDENDRLADSSVQSLNGVTAGTVTASQFIKADANKDVSGLRNMTVTGSFIIGSADMNETDLEKLDGITNGTQAANKAVVADANVNTGVSKITALHIGASGSETEVTATAAELNILDGVTATATEINRAADVSARLVAGGSALSLTEALHDGKTVLFDTAAGTTLTLPAATGSGAKFRCVVSVLATSNSHILKVVGDDIMQGSLGIIDTDTADATIFFATEADSDTITFNRTTTGLGEIGAWIEVQDIAANTWSVMGVAQASGSVATPFSAAVS